MYYYFLDKNLFVLFDLNYSDFNLLILYSSLLYSDETPTQSNSLLETTFSNLLHTLFWTQYESKFLHCWEGLFFSPVKIDGMSENLILLHVKFWVSNLCKRYFIVFPHVCRLFWWTTFFDTFLIATLLWLIFSFEVFKMRRIFWPVNCVFMWLIIVGRLGGSHTYVSL